MERLRVELRTFPCGGAETRTHWTTVSDPAGRLVEYKEALLILAERDALLARIKDLEGQEVKLIETSGACFQVASRFQRDAGDTRIDVADWLEGRLKRLAELEEGEWRLPSLWEERARAAEVKLGSLLSDDTHQFANRIRVTAQLFGYQDKEGELGDWVEARLRDVTVIPYWKDRAHRAEEEVTALREKGGPGNVVCPIFELAQRFRNRDHGPAGESLEQWLEDKLQRAAALDHPIAPASQMAYVPWRSAIRSDVYGPYSKPPISLIPQRLVSAERAISNLEEITAELLTTGDGVDARLGMLDEDVERAKKRLVFLEKDGVKAHGERVMLDRRVAALEGQVPEDGDVSDLWRRIIALEAQAKHQP